MLAFTLSFTLSHTCKASVALKKFVAIDVKNVLHCCAQIECSSPCHSLRVKSVTSNDVTLENTANHCSVPCSSLIL